MKFAEKRNKIAEGTEKKVFNKGDFDELATSMLNDPDYEVTFVKKKNGETVQETEKPMAELRKQLIGSVLKSAGHDAAETEKYIAEHKFPKLELHNAVGLMIEEYTMLGKPYRFPSRPGLDATMVIEDVPEQVKEVRAPGSDEVKRRKYGAFKKAKITSTCPEYLKEDVE